MCIYPIRVLSKEEVIELRKKQIEQLIETMRLEEELSKLPPDNSVLYA